MAASIKNLSLDKLQVEIDRLNEQKDKIRKDLLVLCERRKELLAFEQKVTKLAGAGIKPAELKEMGVSADIQKAVAERQASRLPTPPSQTALPAPAKMKASAKHGK